MFNQNGSTDYTKTIHNLQLGVEDYVEMFMEYIRDEGAILTLPINILKQVLLNRLIVKEGWLPVSYLNSLNNENGQPFTEYGFIGLTAFTAVTRIIKGKFAECSTSSWKQWAHSGKSTPTTPKACFLTYSGKANSGRYYRYYDGMPKVCPDFWSFIKFKSDGSVQNKDLYQPAYSLQTVEARKAMPITPAPLLGPWSMNSIYKGTGFNDEVREQILGDILAKASRSIDVENEFELLIFGAVTHAHILPTEFIKIEVVEGQAYEMEINKEEAEKNLNTKGDGILYRSVFSTSVPIAQIYIRSLVGNFNKDERLQAITRHNIFKNKGTKAAVHQPVDGLSQAFAGKVTQYATKVEEIDFSDDTHIGVATEEVAAQQIAAIPPKSKLPPNE